MRSRYTLGIALLVAVWLIVPGGSISSVHASPAQNGYTTHVVGLGETLYSIARTYNVSPQALAAYNGLANPNYIYAGQRLSIPGSSGPAYERPAPGPGAIGGSHTVRLGETLYAIAARYGTTVSALLAANGLANPDYIYVGQTLRIPGAGAPTGPKPGPAPGPGCGHYYMVKPGETLSGIAWHHGTTIYAIARANGLRFPYIIYSGQSLHIPCDGGTPRWTEPKPQHPGHKPPSRPAPKPDLRPAACARQIQIVSPKMGEHISGTIQIVGTASIENFQFYKIEYAMGSRPLESAFASIGEIHETAVTDSILTTWYTGNMPAGAYTLRLTAVDNRGQAERPCDVRVHIDH